jgi:hypothetical protein
VAHGSRDLEERASGVGDPTFESGFAVAVRAACNLLAVGSGPAILALGIYLVTGGSWWQGAVAICFAAPVGLAILAAATAALAPGAPAAEDPRSMPAPRLALAKFD